ncbi:MAG: hypothetical protein ER33_08340 [Cyanobium sp. CACIAM 14]|nr:MAG: hypothetical protein ER33_08340 [Cyanobium sp. CACIAM 14]
MFTSLQLTRFKAWSDTGNVELAPVTLLLGTNSSGKSSFIQSLLLLKQTVESPDRTIHLNLGGEEGRDAFHFGDFSSILQQGARERQFGIGFDIQRHGDEDRVRRGRFEAIYASTSRGAVVTQQLRLAGDGHPIIRVQRRERGAFSIHVEPEVQARGRSPDYAPERSIALSSRAISLLGDLGPLAEDISLAIRRELEDLIYLGPLRRQPERSYQWNRTWPGEIGADGHRAIDVLLASAHGPGAERHRILDGISRWLRRMELADGLQVRPIGRSSRYEVVIDSQAVSANLRDVGIGLALVLPVLIAALSAPPGATVILEEPEIHLHPLAQSVLAELFVEVSRERRLQFIVETHSEHLFRRMQTLIAREHLAATDCALYFVERESSGSVLRRLAIDPYGRVTNWPDRFFGDSLAETEEQARLMFERRLTSSP